MIDSEFEMFNLNIKPILIKLGYKITNFKKSIEKENYEACSFMLNLTSVICRTAKLTPKKQGQFVAIWKRDKNNITIPYELSDHFDFMMIIVRKEDREGFFLFPKVVLYKNKIVSGEKSKGKNGIRVYPSWDQDLNKIALKTQAWQLEYFIEKKSEDNFDHIKAKRIFETKEYRSNE